jgi:hypothetical protein
MLQLWRPRWTDFEGVHGIDRSVFAAPLWQPGKQLGMRLSQHLANPTGEAERSSSGLIVRPGLWSSTVARLCHSATLLGPYLPLLVRIVRYRI